jgi:hypothetical protein
MSRSLSETAYVGSLSGSGVHPTAARPGRPKAMAGGEGKTLHKPGAC